MKIIRCKKCDWTISEQGAYIRHFKSVLKAPYDKNYCPNCGMKDLIEDKLSTWSVANLIKEESE